MMSYIESILIDRSLDIENETIIALSIVWDEVLERIIKRMLEISQPQMTELHINLKEEMALELVKLQLHIGGKIIDEHLKGKNPEELSSEIERATCFGKEGLEKIENTAKMLSEHVWLRLYKERWEPKTRAEIKREKNPKKRKIVPQPKDNNHFIPKSFIKRYWSVKGDVLKCTLDKDGYAKSRRISFGQWGYLKNLYSDKIEGYFSLIEGDVVRPISMLLNTEPLNTPQRLSLIGFIVIQRLRNPIFVKELRSLMQPIVADQVDFDSSINNEYMQNVYDTLYRNNDLYEHLARPIFNNKWVLLKSNKESFILPDTSVVFGYTEGKRYVIFPISPTICMVVLPIEEIPHRIVPYSINAGDELAASMTKLLLFNVNNEFLSGFSYSHLSNIKEQKETLAKSMVKILSEKCK